jgi:phosphate transport system permease protein
MISPIWIAVTVLLLALGAYNRGYRRARVVSTATGGAGRLHSRPVYYGLLTSLWCALPALMLYSAWLICEPGVITGMVVEHLPDPLRLKHGGRVDLVVNDIRNHLAGGSLADTGDVAIRQAADRYRRLESISRASLAAGTFALALAGGWMAWRRIRPALRARNHVEKFVTATLLACSSIAIFTTIGIILSVLFESIRFFGSVPLHDFLFGLEWSPQIAIRADQVGSSGAFGAVPVFAGTLMIAALAMVVAVPIGLMSAIYLSEYADRRFRSVAKPLLEILAGIPTVVYGFFAALIVSPLMRDLAERVGMEISSESALVAGVVMGIMIIPFVSSLSDDVINAVPQSLRDGALALGATQSETIRQVVLPAALPGIVGGVLLAVSRAIGETMIVVMAAGLTANLSANPLQAVTTVTVQIVTLLVGDQEFDSPKTLAAFALGLVLFLATLVLNIIALRVVRKYREQYE